MESHLQRQKTIKNCVEEASKEVQLLKERKNGDPDNFEILKELRKVQTKVK